MEKLSFDTGIKEYRVNGRSSLKFNPTDQNLYANFVSLYKDMPEFVSKYEAAAKAAKNQDDDADSQFDAESTAPVVKAIDAEVKARLAKAFGDGNDFDAIFDGINVFAPTDTGLTAVENFLEALLPVVEKSAEARQKIMKEKAAAAVEKAQQNREQRRAAK